jgi:hypothetical protein
MNIYNPYTNLFLNNKFTNCYTFIIEKAKSLSRLKVNKNESNYIYLEKHHIIPRSMKGSNDESNLVYLTAYEHFLCHWLLTKMCVRTNHHNKMLYAFKMLYNTRSKNIKHAAEIYESEKEQLSKIGHTEETKKKMSEIAMGHEVTEETRKKLSESISGEKHHSYGKSFTEEHKANMGRKGEDHHFYGKKLSKEHRKKIGEASSKRTIESGIRKPHTDSAKERISNARKGATVSESTLSKLRKIYQVIFPSGESIIVSNRKSFCEANNLCSGTFSAASSKNKPYKSMIIRKIRSDLDIWTKEECFENRYIHLPLKRSEANKAKLRKSYMVTNILTGESQPIDNVQEYCKKNKFNSNDFYRANVTGNSFKGLLIKEVKK